ncbi:MAG: DedA family protein [Bacteroidales bacterium]
MHLLLDFILHIDKYLNEWVTAYQTWTYLILFIIIFCETGLVVTPFLPGDSLLFAAGTIAAMDGNPLNVTVLIVVILVAAFAGDNTNFFIGRFLGKKVYEKNYKLIKREYIDKTHAFYEKHGGKTLVIARFMPIIRTFAPFVAGVGEMKYFRFISFSVIGNFLWVFSFILAGYFFGNIDFVKKNFTLVILTIIFISLLPPVVAIIKQKFSKK